MKYIIAFILLILCSPDTFVHAIDDVEIVSITENMYIKKHDFMEDSSILVLKEETGTDELNITCINSREFIVQLYIRSKLSTPLKTDQLLVDQGKSCTISYQKDNKPRVVQKWVYDAYVIDLINYIANISPAAEYNSKRQLSVNFIKEMKGGNRFLIHCDLGNGVSKDLSFDISTLPRGMIGLLETCKPSAETN